jgi:hypothetical protein
MKLDYVHIYYNVLCRASVAEWLRSLTSNHLLLTAMGSNPDRDFGLSYVRKLCEEAIGASVVLLRCPFVPEKMHGRTPEVFLQ